MASGDASYSLAEYSVMPVSGNTLMILVRIYYYRDALILSIIPHPYLAAHYNFLNFLDGSGMSRHSLAARITTRLVHEWQVFK